MQTFLPYDDFTQSASVLDRARLGKQRVETWQIYNALIDSNYGWQNHPAVNMWRRHEWILLCYGITVCHEWISRGYRDTMLPRFVSAARETEACTYPIWMGNDAFHSSHRAALLFKLPSHYSKFGWTEKPQLNYVWPKP